jgi:dTDP-4-amino-4,6-dideoxygalactose transaminase
VYHLFTILCQDRSDLARYLDAKGIDNAIHYPIPIHMQPIYREIYGSKQGKYPIAEDLANRMLSIPMFPGLTDEQVDTVSSCIIDYCGGH